MASAAPAQYSAFERLFNVAQSGFGIYDRATDALGNASSKIDNALARVGGDSYGQVKFAAKKVGVFATAYFLLAYSTHIVMGIVGEFMLRESIEQCQKYFADRKVAKLFATATALVVSAYVLSSLSISSLMILGTFALGWNWRRIAVLLEGKPKAAPAAPIAAAPISSPVRPAGLKV